MHKEISENNLQFYDNSRTAAAYATQEKLYQPEATIIGMLRPDLKTMDVLDLGVGAGRTTPHLAPHARRYVGCDFSAAMIDQCRKKFPQFEFGVGDACNLRMFPDASFDFILFSFNGIDCMTGEMRAAALGEMHRLLRPGGCFAFSSHNMQFLPQARSWRQNMALLHPSSLREAAKNLARYLRRTRSVVILPNRQTALVTEMHLGHQVMILFIRPAYQIAALRAQGWEDIKALPSDSSVAVTGLAALENLTAPWVYYMCLKPLAGFAQSLILPPILTTF